MPSSALKIKNLFVEFDKVAILNDITLEIPSAVSCGVIGPNGAGKTSFIKAILGLVSSRYNELRILDSNLSQIRQRIAYIPQAALFDQHFPATVSDVVLMGLYPFKKWWQPIDNSLKERAYEALKQVDMYQHEKESFHALSGGQKQRVFIARALAQDADIYFMDEPFTGVDQVTENIMKLLFKNLIARNKTLIVVHHDLASVKELFDWVVILNKDLIASGKTENSFNGKHLSKAYHVDFTF